jgi:hypothetical protein
MTEGSKQYSSNIGKSFLRAVYKGSWSVKRKSLLNQTMAIFCFSLEFSAMSH